MKIRNLLILSLIFNLLPFLSNSQENTINRFFYKKVKHFNVEEYLKTLNNTENQSEINQISTNTTTSQEQKLTHNTKNDVELYSALNPLDTNNIIVSWMEVDESNTTLPLVFKMFYSTNLGESWLQSSINFLPEGLWTQRVVAGGGDPVIVFDKNGRAYISWIYMILNIVKPTPPYEIYIEMELLWAYSDDKGATWTRLTERNDVISEGVFDYEFPGDGIVGVNSGTPPDKQWMTVNPLNNDIYVSLTEFPDLTTLENIWGLRKKSETDLTFGEKIFITNDTVKAATQGSIATDRNGVLHAIFPCIPDTMQPWIEIYHQRSEDLGETFSELSLISRINVENFTASGQPNNTSTKAYNRLNPCAYVGIDTTDGLYSGRIYTVWNANDTAFFSKVDVFISYSDDLGETWSEQKMINTDVPRDKGFHHRPNVFVNKDGVVIVTWYDNRNATEETIYNSDFFVGYSSDGSNTFTEVKANLNSFNYNSITTSFFVGEYYQSIATGRYYMPFWAKWDGSDTEIYFAKIPFDPNYVGIDEIGTINTTISISQIYPNPAKDIINLNINSNEDCIIDISVLDIKGQELVINKKQNCIKGENLKKINVNDFSEGIYFIRVETPYGDFVKKFQKM
jgi:hypothetical protein